MLDNGIYFRDGPNGKVVALGGVIWTKSKRRATFFVKPSLMVSNGCLKMSTMVNDDFSTKGKLALTYLKRFLKSKQVSWTLESCTLSSNNTASNTDSMCYLWPDLDPIINQLFRRDGR